MNSRLSWPESLTAAQTAQQEKSSMKKFKNKLLHVFRQTVSQFCFAMLLWKIQKIDKQRILEHYRGIRISIEQSFRHIILAAQ